MTEINKNVLKIREELTLVYKDFFSKGGLNDRSGLVNRANKDPKFVIKAGEKDQRFATYAYIGSKYGEKKKILFVGLDIGKDELGVVKEDGRFQGFEDRRTSIEWVTKNDEKSEKKEHNPHISGTMVHAGKLLGLNPKDKEFENESYSGGFIEKANYINHFNKDNPLSYIAFLNLRKFVEKDKQNRKQIKWVKKKEEIKLLFDEIKKLDPEIIVLQGASFKNQKDLSKKFKNLGKTIFKGHHPSFRNGERTLKGLLRTYEPKGVKIKK